MIPPPIPPASANGEPLITIGRKGKKKFQIADGPVIEVDIVATFNAWTEIDSQFRDEKREIIPDKKAQWNMAVWKFVRDQQIALSACKTQEEGERLSVHLADKFSMAEALEFLRILAEETNALRSFFDPRFEKGLSSPASTAVKFST